jgi:cell division protein FtsZ
MINFHPSSGAELKPRITVIGVGGAGGNAVNNMIQSHLEGVEFLVANTDAQAMAQSRTDRRIQLGYTVTQGLGAGARPDIGRAAAEESLDEILGQLQGSNMLFITAGMGGGTGTGAAPVIARAAREHGILTVGVVTKPFHFEGQHRMRLADQGIEELTQYVDTLIIIPNQNLFRIASEKTTFADAFKMADDVLYSGVRGVTDLMIMPGLINLDFADIRSVMGEMGKAMMGTGEAEGDKRALDAAEAAISNPLLEDISMKGARGVLINITGGMDMTLFEVDEAANRIRDEVDPEANIIFGSTFDEKLNGKMRVSVVATGIDAAAQQGRPATVINVAEPKRNQPLVQPQAPAAPQAQTVRAAPAAPTLAERVAGTFTAAEPTITSQRPEAAPQQPQPQFTRSEPTLQMRTQAGPAPRPEPNFGRSEPAMTAREQQPLPSSAPPVQGSLRIETPAPALRPEPRFEVQQAAAAPRPAPQPMAQPTVDPQDTEQHRRPSGFLNRLANHVKSSAAQTAPHSTHSHTPQQTAQRSPIHQPEAPAAAQPQSQPSAQAARISPTERPAPTRATDEDLLDIPAFLRRQAN